MMLHPMTIYLLVFDAPSNLWMPQMCTVQMGIIPQNMSQTSNSPYLLT